MQIDDITDEELIFNKEKLNVSFSDLYYYDKYWETNAFYCEEPKEDNIKKDSLIKDFLIEPNLLSENTTKSTFYENIFLGKKEKNNYIITKFRNFIQSNDIKEHGKDFISLRKKRGRKKTTGEHNKFSDDNIRRKIKHLILQSLFIFINKKIKEIYKHDIGKGIFEKKLLKINQKQKSEASIEYNQKFIYKSLGDIFSENITIKYTNFPPTHNRRIINELENDEEFGNPVYFRNLFSLSFVDCLKHFRRDVNIKELEGLEGIETLKNKVKDDKDYLNSLEYYIRNFETIINNKKGRKFKKRKS